MAGSVPQLESDLGVTDIDLLRLEVSAHGGSCIASRTSGKLVNQSGFANIDVAEKDDFGEELLFRIGFNHCSVNLPRFLFQLKNLLIKINSICLYLTLSNNQRACKI